MKFNPSDNVSDPLLVHVCGKTGDMFDERNHAFTICACVCYVEDKCG